MKNTEPWRVKPKAFEQYRRLNDEEIVQNGDYLTVQTDGGKPIEDQSQWILLHEDYSSHIGIKVGKLIHAVYFREK